MAARCFWTRSATSACKTQTDLLRVLQEKEIVRVGGNQQIKVDFRAIAATNKNLEALVKAGTFRPDLYYRLHVFCIDLPPLRDRREDIPLLVNHFLNKFCMATSRPAPQISAEALDVLMRHDWPGNVRELENAVERALVVGRGTGDPAGGLLLPVRGRGAQGRPDAGGHRAGAHRAHPAGDAAQPLARGADSGYRPHHALQQTAPLRIAVKPIHLIPLANRARTAPEPALTCLEHLAAGAGAHCFARPAASVRRPGRELRRATRGAGSITRRRFSSSWSARGDPDARVLGVTTCDLYVPVLTFVFGEAQLDGNCAVVSTARLHEEFYGLPRERCLLRERLIKEAAHELGHTFGLRHCPDWRCVMSSSHARGAAGRQGRGILRGLPEGGGGERVLVKGGRG